MGSLLFSLSMTNNTAIDKGRGFRGGSDEKMRRMWFGLEIDVVGLPPLVEGTEKFYLKIA